MRNKIRSTTVISVRRKNEVVIAADGQVTLEQDQGMYYARLTGNVSTKNYGGFIQLRTGISFANSDEQ